MVGSVAGAPVAQMGPSLWLNGWWRQGSYEPLAIADGANHDFCPAWENREGMLFDIFWLTVRRGSNGPCSTRDLSGEVLSPVEWFDRGMNH